MDRESAGAVLLKRKARAASGIRKRPAQEEETRIIHGGAKIREPLPHSSIFVWVHRYLHADGCQSTLGAIVDEYGDRDGTEKRRT